MASDEDSKIHRVVVEALGDRRVAGVAGESWLEGSAWGEAIERARSERFPSLPREEGFLSVGRELGQQFIASPEGRVLSDSLQTMSLDQAFSRLLPILGTRWRRPIEVEWIRSEAGGILRSNRKRITPAEVTLGFLEQVVSSLRPPPRLRLLRDEEDLLEIVVER